MCSLSSLKILIKSRIFLKCVTAAFIDIVMYNPPLSPTRHTRPSPYTRSPVRPALPVHPHPGSALPLRPRPSPGCPSTRGLARPTRPHCPGPFRPSAPARGCSQAPGCAGCTRAPVPVLVPHVCCAPSTRGARTRPARSLALRGRTGCTQTAESLTGPAQTRRDPSSSG